MSLKICPVCGGVARRDGVGKVCMPCVYAVTKISGRAQRAVFWAVLRGQLPRADTLTCVDCGAPAWCYDHRDYDKPLDVQPVCRSCNWHRGPAVQLQPGARMNPPVHFPPWWRRGDRALVGFATTPGRGVVFL